MLARLVRPGVNVRKHFGKCGGVHAHHTGERPIDDDHDQKFGKYQQRQQRCHRGLRNQTFHTEEKRRCDRETQRRTRAGPGIDRSVPPPIMIASEIQSDWLVKKKNIDASVTGGRPIR